MTAEVHEDGEVVRNGTGLLVGSAVTFQCNPRVGESP